MKHAARRIGLIALGWLCGLGSIQGEVVINEILYHPQSEDVREEFVELLNTGLFAVDLSGWKLTRGIKFFAVAGKKYSIVYRDCVTGGPWFKLPDVVAPLTGGEQTVIDSTIGAVMLRVYRLVTPMLP